MQMQQQHEQQQQINKINFKNLFFPEHIHHSHITPDTVDYFPKEIWIEFGEYMIKNCDNKSDQLWSRIMAAQMCNVHRNKQEVNNAQTLS